MPNKQAALLADMAMAALKRTKEITVEGDGADGDLIAMATVHRAVKLEASVILSARPGPTGVREMCRLAGLFAPTYIVLAADAYVRRMAKGTRLDEVNLGPGDLSEQWEEGAREDTTEGLTVQAAYANGIESRQWPYVRSGNRVRWGELQKGGTVDGAMVAALRSAFDDPAMVGTRRSMIELVESSVPGLSQEDAVDRSIATLAALEGFNVVLREQDLVFAGEPR